MFSILTFCTTGWLLNQQAWKKMTDCYMTGNANKAAGKFKLHNLSCTWVPSSLFTIIHLRMLVRQRGPTEQYNVYTVPHNFIYLFIFNLKSILNQKIGNKTRYKCFFHVNTTSKPPKNLNRGVPRLHSPDSRSWRTLSLRSLVESLLARVAPLRPVNEDPLASLWMCCCRCRRRSSGPAGRH